MELENLSPLEELKRLEEEVNRVSDLAELKPIFSRIDEIGRENSGDFEIQLAVDELKQRAVDRGKQFKQSSTPPSSIRVNASTSEPPPDTGMRVRPRPAISEQPPAASIPPRPGPASPSQGSWKRALALGAIAGAIVSLLLIAFLVNQARKRNLSSVELQITTLPPGADIRVSSSQGNESRCNSNCSVAVSAGQYQITAFLDGYEPATDSVRVTAGRPASVNLPLTPAAQTLRILTDLTQGQVTFDDQPPADLQDGQFVIDHVAPGTHKVTVTSKTGQASFSVEIADAKFPVITGPVAARNLIAVLVSSVGNKARVVTNSGPLKLSVNGQSQGDATPEGVDLNGFQTGVDEIVVGEGKDQRNFKENFGPAPALTAFLKSDLNIGTLIVSTGQDDVHVFVNDKEYPRRTKNGQIRIPTIGNIAVRVAKDGFETVPPQTASVQKGAEVRMEFKMQALPQTAVLQLRGATPGADVLLDQKNIGKTGDDGSFTYNAVPLGDHTIELQRDRYAPKRLQRTFRAGQTVAIAGVDVALSLAVGTVRLNRTPAEASVTYRRADESQSHEVNGNQLDLPPGNYVFTGRLQGFTDKAERVDIAAGETRTVEIALARVPPPPQPKVLGMSDFSSGAWAQQGDVWTHRGAGFIPYRPTPKGVFTFNVQLLKGGNIFRGGRIRWALQYVDEKNYDLFELDNKNLSSKVIINGVPYDRGKYEHNLSSKDKSYAIQIDVSPARLIHRVQAEGEWKTLDTWSEPGRDFTQGKFGFIVQGNDEIGLSDFKFAPK